MDGFDGFLSDLEYSAAAGLSAGVNSTLAQVQPTTSTTTLSTTTILLIAGAAIVLILVLK